MILCTNPIADTHITRRPKQISLDKALEQIEKGAMCTVQETGDRTVKEVLEVFNAQFES